MDTGTENPAGRSLAERGLVRLNFNLPVDDANLLAKLAERTGYNKATTIVRALRVLDGLEAAAQRGATVNLAYTDGSRERLLLR